MDKPLPPNRRLFYCTRATCGIHVTRGKQLPQAQRIDATCGIRATCGTL